MFVVYSIITLLCLIFGAFLHKQTRMYKIADSLPGPKIYPLIGNGFVFLNKTPPEILQIMTTNVKKYGKFIRLLLGTQLNLLVTDPKIIETVLSSQKLIDKSYEYTFLQKWLGDGLLLSTGKKWFARRKAITPTFHFKILEEFIEIFDRQSNTFVENLSKFKSSESFDVYPYVTLCTLDAICETAMGTTANAQTNSESEYVKAVKTIANINHLRMFNVFLRNPFLFSISPSARKQEAALKILHGFTDRVIVARRNELMKKTELLKFYEKGTAVEDETNDVGIKKKMALLDVLLQSNIDGKPLSNMDIREEVDTFMFEGHDTTTSGITLLFYNIAKYPEVQKKLFKEIKNVIGDDKTKPVGLKELNELHYLDLVIKESMRLFPPVPIFGRGIKEDIVIEGRLIPAGANLAIGVYFMGRDPDLYPDPLTFKPERFDVETNTSKTNPYAYIPFSAGPRNCIGQKFALNEMKSICSKMLRHYELSLGKESQKELTLIAELILRPDDGIFLHLKPRIY